MMKIPWYQKIQIQIPMIVFLIILIPAAAFSSYDIRSSRRVQLENRQDSMQQRLYETSLLMQDVMQQIENTGKMFTEDPSFDILLSQYLESPQDSEARSRLLLAMGQSAWPSTYMEQMYLIGENTPFILSSDPEEKLLDIQGTGQALYQTWEEQTRGQTTWTFLPSDQAETENETNQRIAYWRSVETGSEETSVSLVCVLKEEYLSNIMSGLAGSEGGLNAVSSYQGRLLYSDSPEAWPGDSLAAHPLFEPAYSGTENSGSYFVTVDGVKWLAVHYNSLEDGWKYLSAIPEQQIYSGIADRSFLYVLAASGVFGVLFGSLVLYYLVVNPLRKLQHKMQRMEQGQLETLNYTGSKNEIGQVLRTYDRMIVRLKKLIDEVYVQQLLRKQAELSALQSQMDEHFLYNTLNTIYCKASKEKADTSAAMILKLSQYFRLSLANGQEKIPLNEIMGLIRSYLQIQQLRYGQSLTCRIETFPDMEQYVSLKQLYQPIIENAVIHGFERKLGSHKLEIHFEKAGDRLRFIVRDDGVGMSSEHCREVIAGMNTFEHVQGKGFALRNIREQIRIVYGDTYGITLESELNQGTTVILEVPLERRNECTELVPDTGNIL